MWQNSRVERDKSILRPGKCTWTWQKRLFLILYRSLSFCLSSVLTLASALCILVCVATLLLGLCVFKKKKKEPFKNKESIKASSDTGLSEAVLSERNRTILLQLFPTARCCISGSYILGEEHDPLLQEWPSASGSNPQPGSRSSLRTAGAAAGWARLTSRRRPICWTRPHFHRNADFRVQGSSKVTVTCRTPADRAENALSHLKFSLSHYGYVCVINGNWMWFLTVYWAEVQPPVEMQL